MEGPLLPQIAGLALGHDSDILSSASVRADTSAPAVNGTSPVDAIAADHFLPNATLQSKLSLTGNVISAAFYLPQNISLSSGGEWLLSTRKGSSAMFDSLSHLSSRHSPWNHTLVGWTGEIERVSEEDIASPRTNGDVHTTTPLNNASAPIPFNATAKAGPSKDLADPCITSTDRKRLVKQLELENGARVVPVWLHDAVQVEDYDSYTLCRQDRWGWYGERQLYPTFHYKYTDTTMGQMIKKAWSDYQHLNRAFADAVLSVYRPGDIVVIHDYQLLLLPEMLRHRVPNIYIGFFLHTPFPDYEFFRSLSQRQAILEGMLGANMIGFQTQNHRTYFSDCCREILGAKIGECHAYGVEMLGQYTSLEDILMGVDAAAIQYAAFTPTVEEQIAELREMYADKHIIVGRDKLDSTRGIVPKLQAFEIFLNRQPEWQRKVVLIQVTSPPTRVGANDKTDMTESKVSDLVTRINGNYGDLSFSSVHYFPQYLSREEYFALLRIADVGLITSVCDGMNTTALEYVLCQRDNHGPLIISDFSGTQGQLSKGAISVNPWDFVEVADAIHQALTKSSRQKQRDHRALYNVVTRNTIQAWTSKFLSHLMIDLIAAPRLHPTPSLNPRALLQQYHASTRRLFMFDYDGTLTPIVPHPSAAIPTSTLLHTLHTLASDPANTVWIISGRDQNFLSAWMGSIAPLGLSAEHGSFIRKPHSTAWENLTETLDLSWQAGVLEIFTRYTASTPGSVIERKKIAVTWHYRGASDSVLAAQNAHQCQRDLEHSIARAYDVEIMAGKANLEVRPRWVNKGEIAKRLVREYRGGDVHGAGPDFVMCVGDDSTDEGSLRPFVPFFNPDLEVLLTMIFFPEKICSALLLRRICRSNMFTLLPWGRGRNIRWRGGVWMGRRMCLGC